MAVHRRDILDRLEAPACLHVEEVVEEPAVERDAGRGRASGRVSKEAQRRQRPLARRLARDPATLDADRIRRQAEAHGGHARERGRRLPVGNEAVLRIRLVPEPAEGALLEVVEEGDVGAESGPFRRDGDGSDLCRRRERARTRNREEHDEPR